MEKEILDEAESLVGAREQHPLVGMIAWWERRRLWYNAGLVLLQMGLCLFYYRTILLFFGVTNALLYSVCYTLAANAFYCLGWGTEILLNYYFPNFIPLKRLSPLFFILGILFSIFLTIMLYSVALGGHLPF